VNSKHTSAPWTVHTCEVHPHHEIVAGNGRRIATQNDYHDGQDKANALLIAAAPDMLEALRMASDILMSVRVEVYNHNRKEYSRVEKTIDLIKLVMEKAIGDKA
jgi:hypothetical protein